MNQKVTVVALSRYPDIFNEFRKQIDRYISKDVRKILVRDGELIKTAPGWEIIQGPAKFTMAANHNVGWRAVEADSDILNLNDDIYFLEQNPIRRYQELAYSLPIVGAVAARVKVGAVGNPLQMRPLSSVPLTYVRTSGNGCTYFKREVIDKVGLFDEGYNEPYSAEDADYTWRINMAGYRVAIARDIPVKHGFERNVAASTTFRALTREEVREHNKRGIDRFVRKWGHFGVHGLWDDSIPIQIANEIPGPERDSSIPDSAPLTVSTNAT